MASSLIEARSNQIALEREHTLQEMQHAQVQAAKLVLICVTAYPHSDKYQGDQAVDNTVNLWANQFVDDDWRIVGLAIKKHIATNKWAPSVAEIREAMVNIQRPDLIPTDEAFSLVAQYIDATPGGDYRGASDVFPPIIASAVNSIGGLNDLRDLRNPWKNGGKVGLDRLAFRDAYDHRLRREREEAMLPPTTRAQIAAAQHAMGGAAMAEYDRCRALVEQLQADRERINRRCTEIPQQKNVGGGQD